MPIIILFFLMVSVFLIYKVRKQKIAEKEYKELELEILNDLGIANLFNYISYIDIYLTVKSRQTLEKYDAVKFFQENKSRLELVQSEVERKNESRKKLIGFLAENKYKSRSQYNRIEEKMNELIKNATAYRINVKYISTAGNNLGEKVISVNQSDINRFLNDPSILMTKSEYNKILKEQQKEALNKKQHEYYELVNEIIDCANISRDILVVKGAQEQVDSLIAQLFDRTVNSIKKVKSIDSEEWDIIKNFIIQIDENIQKIISKNQMIIEYYESPNFLKLKNTCETLMSKQREFNEYITEKVNSISTLFGTKVIRNETIVDDEYKYIRPYKKSITPFTAELSANVFASAENNPLEYIVKNFYPNKAMYPEQIQKLHLLIEEIETLKEAKKIIDANKTEYQQYLSDVPSYILENDEAGFYAKLGFANIDEDVLVVEYKFAYTSGGGMAKRAFTVPMVEDTIIELIKTLESKLTISAFTKEQRALMTRKLRESVKMRDKFTCCNCGNSISLEPNLLLEIDHIIPVSKGGCTVEENLQTLCWKCNRAKSNKIIN